jgi:hypothetical protein
MTTHSGTIFSGTSRKFRFGFESVHPEGRKTVAKKQIIVSDLSGKEIRDPKDSASVTIRYGDARRGQISLDVLADEVNDLAAKGRKTARRGRKPKSES